jgi:hypothetical protein
MNSLSVMISRCVFSKVLQISISQTLVSSAFVSQALFPLAFVSQALVPLALVSSRGKRFFLIGYFRIGAFR